MFEKIRDNLVTISLLGVFIISLLWISGVVPVKDQKFEGSVNGDVGIEDLKHIATTTGSFAINVPVKLIDVDYGRRYMVISNTDATNNIYVYATTTELGLNFFGEVIDTMDSSTSTLSSTAQIATSTITNPLDGILIAPKTSFEFDADNLVVGEVWASSTEAVNIQVNVNWK